MKLTITQVGNPKDVQTKFGLKQKSYIKASEKGDTYLSYWVSSATRDWKVGDVIEVLNVTSRDYNGKTYWDIVMPKTSGGIPPEVTKTLEEINGRTLKILLMVEELGKKLLPQENKIPGTDMEYPEENINPDDIPF